MLTIRQGPCFRYAVPAGWRVVEDGQFAVVLVAPDQRAVTTLVGNAGLPHGTDPARFVWDKLAQSGLSAVRFGPPRPAPPLFPGASAVAFDVDYAVGGVPCRGEARCTVAGAYDSCTMVMTWAASEISQWPHYASWLPDVAAQVQVVHPAAFGSAGIAAQNLQNSMALGEQARRDREGSAQQWAEVTRQREASAAAQADGFRQALGGVERYHNPYDGRPIELPAVNTVYWVHPATGRIVGDPNPSFDPRSPMDASWQPLRREPGR